MRHRHVNRWKAGPMSRECGPCDRCCELLPVAELGLLAGERCQHQTGTAGCAIYSQRPDVCRNYACLWLSRDVGSGPNERPDRARAVPTMSDNGRYLVLYLEPGLTPDTMTRAARAWVRRWHNRRGVAAIVLHGDGYNVSTVLPPDGTREDRATEWVGPLAQLHDNRRKSAKDDNA